jgi:selenocysteine lyase/cysteine desulfurase
LFPGTKRLNYLFNGGTCLTSIPVRNAVEEFLSEVENGISGENWQKWDKRATTAYKLFADLIGADKEEVLATPNTTVGMGMVAQMIDPKPRSNLVLDDLEYQTIFPFTIRKKKGVQMRLARNVGGYSNIDQLESLVDDKTSAIVVSAVSCWNGYRYDLKVLSEIARRHGAYLVVDGAQQVGAVKLDVERSGIDFLATCGHKWLLAPPGTGFLYVRRELIGRFDPVFPGWMSVTEQSSDDVWNPVFPNTATRFESGMKNFMLISAMKASLEMIHSLSPQRIEKEILKRTTYLIEKLADIGVEVFTPSEEKQRAGLVTFLLKKHDALFKALTKRSIVAYHHQPNVVRNLKWPTGGLRVDPTFFNTFEELDELLGLVRRYHD